MLNSIDRRILRQWQFDPTLTPAELAKRAGVSLGKLGRRQARLRDEGIVQGVQAVVDWVALGYAVEVSLRVTLDKNATARFRKFYY